MSKHLGIWKNDIFLVVHVTTTTPGHEDIEQVDVGLPLPSEGPHFNFLGLRRRERQGGTNIPTHYNDNEIQNKEDEEEDELVKIY